MNQVKIGLFIQTERKELGFTQKELADKVGVSDKTISKWETGNGLPDLSSMEILCETLHITVNELLSGEKLSPSDYSQQAEVNMMNLLKENEEKGKFAKVQVSLGVILGILAITFLGLSSMGMNMNIIINFIDMPSLIELVLIEGACILSAGRLDKKSRIQLIMKSIIPAGAFATLFGAVVVGAYVREIELIGPNLAVAILPLVYAMLIYLVLIPIEKRVE